MKKEKANIPFALENKRGKFSFEMRKEKTNNNKNGTNFQIY